MNESSLTFSALFILIDEDDTVLSERYLIIYLNDFNKFSPLSAILKKIYVGKIMCRVTYFLLNDHGKLTQFLLLEESQSSCNRTSVTFNICDWVLLQVLNL